MRLLLPILLLLAAPAVAQEWITVPEEQRGAEPSLPPETPQVTAVSGPRGSIFSRARSVSSSVPTTRAGCSEPSCSATTTRLALPTTWLLVTMKPAGSMMKPLPAPTVSCRRLRWRSRK